METLFNGNNAALAPLADRMRPTTLDEFVGQKHIVGEGKLLRRAILTDRLQSSIFFGPPGTGKTTLASIIASGTGAAFAKLNAVTSGVKELREIIGAAETRLRLYSQPTYLLLDECHRWSKAQSDCLLPALERGIVRFIGSTTENPMIAMTSAIVSRCRVFQFYPLTTDDIIEALNRALSDPQRGLGKMNIVMENGSLETIAAIANGDCRNAMNALELAVLTTAPDSDGVIRVTENIAEESSQRKVIKCDEQQYYDMLSAFCKSLRGSDSEAALAWFARMIYAGVDPRIIARRLIAHASEDIGLANPQAMVQAVTAAQSVELIGMPEAALSLTQAIIFLCESPKSNAVVVARDLAFSDAESSYDEPVPIYLRDRSYSGAKKLGHGIGYKYPHDYPGHWVDQDYMPVSLTGKQYYFPGDIGAEAKIKENREKRFALRKHPPKEK